jgi:hypothetical protein
MIKLRSCKWEAGWEIWDDKNALIKYKTWTDRPKMGLAINVWADVHSHLSMPLELSVWRRLSRAIYNMSRDDINR